MDGKARGQNIVLRLALVVAIALPLFLVNAANPAPAGAVALPNVRGVVNASAGLQLRSGASTKYRVIATLPHGTNLTIIGTSSDWFKVKALGKTGYVNSWYVKLSGPSSKAIYRGNTNRKMIALTFDCGADLGHAERILSILDEYGVKASFGLCGSWIKKYPGYAKWVVGSGHQVINHTLNHPSYTGYSTGGGALSPAKRLSQIVANETLIQSTTGVSSKPYWRPPYGDIDSGVLRDVGSAGWSRTVLWTVDTMGWAGATPDQIYRKVVDNAGNGVIVLMHVGGASRDVDALERIIRTLRNRGYAFGTVAQVIAP